MDSLISIPLNIVSVIQLMVAPAVMISACGLILLSMNNRYSLVVNRIRLLNEEKRRILLKIGERPSTTDDNLRLESAAKQIQFLTFRVKLVRNAVLCNVTAIGLFVATSLLIGISAITQILPLNYFIISAFLLGMIFVFASVVYAGFETIKGYEIIRYEVKVHE